MVLKFLVKKYDFKINAWVNSLNHPNLVLNFYHCKKIKMNSTIGLCLSGGGARGIAHIGVIKALEEENILPAYVAGTSAGSIVGALYAAGVSADKMWEIVQNTNLFRIFKLKLGLGLMDISQLRTILGNYIPNDDFEKLQRKLYVCVTNLNKGKWEIMQSGTVFDKVEASCSIPLIFKPVKIGQQLYADGGMLNNLPTEPLRIVCDKIIGVSVMPVSGRKAIHGFMEMAERSIDIVVHDNTDSRLDDCDVKLEIEGIDMFGLFEFNQAREIYELGYDCAKSQMDKIKEILAL